MSQDLPRLGVVGTGRWGRNLVRTLSGLGVLEAVCDIDEARSSTIAKEYAPCRGYTSYRELLADSSIEGIVIATPVESHGTLVREALLADRDVFVEKPICLTLSEGQSLVRLAHARNRILMVGHLLWYHPALLKLKECVDAGELGRIQYIYSNRLNLGQIRREENILWSFAPHDISVILGLLEEMPDSVLAQGGNYLHRQIADVTVSLLSFPSGIKAHIFVSWLHPFKEQKLIVVGDRKMAVFDDTEETDKLQVYPHSIEWKHQLPVATEAAAEAISFDREEPLRAECRHFIECIRTRRPPRTDGEEALRVLTVLHRCQAALDENRAATADPSKAGYFAHDSAFIDEDAEIGNGTQIWHVSHVLQGSRVGENCRIGQNVVVGPNARIGNGVKIQNNVSVYEGVTLEDGVFCGPSVVFTNVKIPRSQIPRMADLKPTLVRCGATLGANSTIVCGITIGRYAFVGAGAVVLREVPDYTLVAGNPARVIGAVCECGVRLDENQNELSCLTCDRRYIRTDGSIAPLDEGESVER